MSAVGTGAAKSRRERIAGVAGWLAVAGLLFLATLWASEPGGADPPASSWNPGNTVTTWDWEQHWNYWMRSVCVQKGYTADQGVVSCIRWSRVGPIWKPCGSKIRPPDPDRTNSCGIGQVGGHDPHGDDLNEKYTYLSRHEDRTGPTYPVCEGDPSLPADTSPDNCGTWVTIPHAHCRENDDDHPPDCPPSATEPSTITSSSSTTSSSTTTRPSTAVSPSTTEPVEPGACEEPEVFEAFYDAVEDQPRPGLGLDPAAYGYVRVPMKASFTADPVDSFTLQIDDDRVYVRLWVSRVSWSFTDLGTLDGVELGSRTFNRHAPSRSAARRLRSPATVNIGGQTVVYRRSSFRSGYERGYPLLLRVTWKAECRQRGVPGWTELDEETRRYRYDYKVYAIRSRPD